MKNIKEFIEYRDNKCVFCDQELIVRGRLHHYFLEFEIEPDKLVIKYDPSDNNFFQLLGISLEWIYLSVNDNSLNYKSLEDQDPEIVKSIVDQYFTDIVLYKACYCNNMFMIHSNSMDFSSNSKPEININRETFYYWTHNFGDIMSSIMFILYFKDKCQMNFFHEEINGSIVNLPWIDFDFQDKEKLDKKIRMLITFS